MLTLLVDDGFVLRRPDRPGCFALGHKVAALANTAIRPTVCTAARDLLTELRNEIRFGVRLYSYTDTVVRLVAPDPEYPCRSDENYLNQHLHASAVGKLILAEKDRLDSTFQRGGLEEARGLAATKQGLRRAMDPDWHELGAWVTTTHKMLFATEDHREGVRSFLEKREPRYVGR